MSKIFAYPQPHTVPLASYISMTLIHALFYGVGLLTVYAVVTLNWYIITSEIIIILLQLPFKGRNQKYVNFLVKYGRPHEYFDLKRVYQQQVPNNQKTLFCVHPHSIFSYGLITSLNYPLEPESNLSKAVGLGSQFVLNTPLVGLHMRSWGIQSADPVHFKQLMKEGKPLLLLPGGYEEATLTTPKEVRVFIKDRKGFIKYALQNGYTIRQILTLNEHKAMWTLDKFLNLRLLFNKLKIPAIIYWCRTGVFFPPNVKITTIVGKAIKGRAYAQGQKATKQQVDAMHAQYVERLKQFYGRYQAQNGGSEIKFY